MRYCHSPLRLSSIVVLATAMSVSSQETTLPRQEPARVADSSLSWESANAKRMFVVTSEGSPISAIAVDTTHIEDLRAALKLQELVFRIGGARLPLVDKQFVTVPWGKIHISWDHFPQTRREHPYSITMRESQPTSHNPAKQIIISGSGDDVEQAVSAFTEAAWGVSLDALKDEPFKWRRRNVLAVPEKLKPIYGRHPNR